MPSKWRRSKAGPSRSVNTILLISLIALSLSGTALAVLQLPGTWVILISAVGYDWYYGWQRIGWQWLFALGLLAVAAEVVDSLAAVVAARRCGASRRAALGALVGGFAGMLLLSVPVPVIGTVIGGLVGCFVGALGAELTKHNNLAAGARVGLFATIGRVIGLAAKTSAALVIGGATVAMALRAAW